MRTAQAGPDEFQRPGDDSDQSGQRNPTGLLVVRFCPRLRIRTIQDLFAYISILDSSVAFVTRTIPAGKLLLELHCPAPVGGWSC